MNTFRNMRRSSILMIYTGGTIGMKQDPQDMTLKPFDFHQILDEVPELKKFALRIDSYTFDPLIAAKIAGLKGVSVEEVAETTTNNAKTLFGI